MRKETAQERDRSFGSRIDFDLPDTREIFAVRNNNAVNRATCRNGNAVDNPVNRVAEKLEAGNESDIEFTRAEPPAKRRWMIELDRPRPAMDKRPGIEIFNAADAQSALRANELGLGRVRSAVFSSFDRAVKTIALDRDSAGFADGMFQRRDRLFLRRFRSGHVENLLFHNGAMQIVHAISERYLRKRQTHAHPVGGEMIDVIEVNAAHGKVTQLFKSGSWFDVRQHGGLRLEGKRNESGKTVGFILQLAQPAQMIYSLFEGLNVTV